MDENKIRCPKCMHEQNEQLECEACGLIFARYDQAQQRQKDREAILQAGQEQRKKKTGSLLQIAILVLVTASVTYYFSRGKTEPEEPGPETIETKITETKQQTIQEPRSSAQSPRPAVLNDTPPTLRASPLEHARHATVIVSSPTNMWWS